MKRIRSPYLLFNQDLLAKRIMLLRTVLFVVLFGVVMVMVWTMRETDLFPRGEESLMNGDGFEGLVRFEKVAVVGHHNWPSSDQQGVVVALLPCGKVALVSNEPVLTDVPEGENVINMFVLDEQNRHWNFRETVFTCPKEFGFITFKVSGDGKSLVVGCSDHGKHSLVRMLDFQENEGTWSLDSFSFDDVGDQVDISNDGRTIVIGSPLGRGHVHVAHKTWTSLWHRSELIPLDLEDFEGFGSNIAISGDGNTVAAIATASYRTSVALLFQRTAFGSWQQQGPKLGKGAPAFYQYSLFSLALSSNGQTLALAGGRLANSSEENVLIFDRTSAGEWYQHGSLVPYDSVGYGYLGQATSISKNGNLILTCGPFDNTTKGACWVFARRNKNSQFTQQGAKYQVIHDEQHCGDPCIDYMFGRSANMLVDASAFIIGGHEHPDNCDFPEYNSGCLGGGAIIYRRSSGRTDGALD